MPNVFIPREQRPGETRVAATPETVKRMTKAGLTVTLERGAGAAAFFPDSEYEAAGARLEDDAARGWSGADAVLAVTPPSPEAVAGLRKDALLVSFLAPHRETGLVRALAAGGASSLAMELIPRITRAQSMDALSSQANIAGYKAVMMAADRYQRLFPMLMTAAGTIQPAKVFVVGAGVAGLQAIATAHRAAFPGPVIGVTGSAGKTTIKDLTAHVLEGADQAADLSFAGLNRVTISLDTLRADRFRTLTKRDLHYQVFDGIKAVVQAGLDRHQADPGHAQAIREHAVAVALAMRETGRTDNDLLDLLLRRKEPEGELLRDDVIEVLGLLRTPTAPELQRDDDPGPTRARPVETSPASTPTRH